MYRLFFIMFYTFYLCKHKFIGVEQGAVTQMGCCLLFYSLSLDSSQISSIFRLLIPLFGEITVDTPILSIINDSILLGQDYALPNGEIVTMLMSNQTFVDVYVGSVQNRNKPVVHQSNGLEAWSVFLSDRKWTK